ncbi:hypothetical protein OKA05_24160 [Luteolibacter arcticus]|uniref:Uncharacterized protein n=1 Tax=Luteolibacter arcticus TaxID=1581411 RepID=A0ABT3GQC0_9BACT|nr:hypothetical protein [Luteolibacter arcticus]MCW1925674.1 hypothetical protein [Luteolibacter arcticus]
MTGGYKYGRGDLFAIALPKRGWGVGQVLGIEKKCLNSVAVSISSQLLEDELGEIEPITKANCISLFLTFPRDLASGRWKILKRSRVKTPLLWYPHWRNLRFNSGVGATVADERTVEEFVAAFHGQAEWGNLKRFLVSQ